MDAASAVAGIIGLAGLALETTLKIRELCEGYSTAEEDVSRVLGALQSLQDLLQETQRLTCSPSVVRATTVLTKTRMENLLNNCNRDLKVWLIRIDNALPHKDSKVKQRWRKIIVAVDKPKLVDLVSRASAYTSRIDGMLAIMQGDVGVATNATVVTMLWSEGIFKFNTKKQLEAIHSDLSSLQVSQNGFQSGTFTRLDTIGSAISSIEVNVQELLYRSVQEAPRPPVAEVERGHLLIPYIRNGNFVGRQGVLKDVEQKLQLPTSNGRVALYGLGGVGKSQVAIEVAYRAQDATPGISCFWVSAVSRATFTQSYRQIATSLAVPGTESPNNDVLDLVKLWLQKEQTLSWLMIIDNVDDLRTLKGESDDTDGFNLLQSLPQCTHGKLLFTTRSKTAGLRLTGGGVVVQIPAMEADEAQRLLQVRLGDDDEALKQDCLALVTALEYLPLPISHAASYIREMDITPSRYLRMFNDDKKITKLLTHTYEDLARDGGQTNTVLTTWRISFEQIQRDSPESAHLLRVMGSLHWQDIPQYLLQQDNLQDEDDFDDIVVPLVAFSLVQKSAKAKTFSMHRLIHIAIRTWNQTLDWERTAQKLILLVFPTLEMNEVSTEKNTRCRQLLPHAQMVLDSLSTSDPFSLMSVQLKYRIAAYLFISTRFQRARDLLMSLVTPLKEFSERGITAGFSQADLEDKITRIYFVQGQEVIAIRRAKETLDNRIGSLPADHPDIIRAKDLFAVGLIAQAKFKEAEEQLKATYSLVVRRYGKTNIMRITLLFSLGAAYTGQGLHQLAADTYKEVLDALVPVYGERNDCAIRCMGAMGDSLRCLYMTKESGILIRKALALSEETLGVEHPLTLGTARRFAYQLLDEGDRRAAFAMFERVWKGHQRLYGADSHITLVSFGRMAKIHKSSREGEGLLKVGIKRSKKTFKMLGPTRLLQNWLAEAYIERLPQSLAGTEAYCRALLKNRKAAKAPARALYQAGHYLVTTLRIKGSLDEAETLCKATLNRQIKLLGSDHFETWQTKDSLCLIAGEKHNWDQVEILLHQQIKFFEETRGPYHCHTLNKKSCLGAMLGQGVGFVNTAASRLRADEGCTIMTDAYNNFVKYYGKSHILTILAISRLANYHCSRRNNKSARNLYQVAVEACRKEFGENGRSTMEYEARLGLTILIDRDIDGAIRIFERIYPIQKRRMFDESLLTAMFWGSSVACIDGRESEGYNIIKTEALDRFKAKFGTSRIAPFQTMANLIRDVILLDATAWNITYVDRHGKFGDFESIFPFPHQTITKPPPKPLRRVKSWHLATARFRQYPYRICPEERLDVFRDLRGQERIELKQAPGWDCLRCQQSIPITSTLYRCYQKSCADGRYIVCESCHKKGLGCLHFEHSPVRSRAYVNCNLCFRVTWDLYTWNCEFCSENGFIVCDWCHKNGTQKSCPVTEHRLYKRLQPCYRWETWGVSYCWCNVCKNEIDFRDNNWHCAVCDEGDYDVCLDCRENGATCKDQSHELIKQDRWGIIINDGPAKAKVAAISAAT